MSRALAWLYRRLDDIDGWLTGLRCPGKGPRWCKR